MRKVNVYSTRHYRELTRYMGKIVYIVYVNYLEVLVPMFAHRESKDSSNSRSHGLCYPTEVVETVNEMASDVVVRRQSVVAV